MNRSIVTHRAFAVGVGAVAVAAGGLLAPTVVSAANTASHATVSGSGPREFTQSANGQSLLLGSGPNNPFTPVARSQPLGKGNWLYSITVDIAGVPKGATVLCGQEVLGPVATNGGPNTGLYGIVDNSGGSHPISGECVMNGVQYLPGSGDQNNFWAFTYSGVSGATVTGWSMTETRVGATTYN